MDVKILVSGIIGLSPALIMLWLALRKYDYPYVEKTLFDARKVFLMFAVGIVFGMVAGALYYYISKDNILIYSNFLFILLIATGLAIFEEMFKFVVLNLKRLQLKFDTVFYGFSLGVGLSSTFVLSHVYFTILLYSSVPPNVWVSLVVFSVTLCLIHGSTGAIIGYGSAKGRPWHFFLEAMVIRAFFIIILIPILVGMGEEWLKIASLGAALLLSIFIFYSYTSKDIILNALPESIKRKKRIKSRRIKERKY